MELINAIKILDVVNRLDARVTEIEKQLIEMEINLSMIAARIEEINNILLEEGTAENYSDTDL